ncbi:MAG: hypothetical protein JW863_16680 [Chitinispirillaceae bacterium]|nr:hypothetical protein [Chitinispirillaceae bacterium]
MVNSRILPFLVFTGLILPLVLLCSGNKPAPLAGGLETTNGIAVRVTDGVITGTASVPSSIIICDSGYSAPALDTFRFADTITTDKNGEFTFSEIPYGTYTLIVRSADLTGGCIIPGITLGNNYSDRYDSVPFVPLAALTIQTFTASTPCQNTVVFIRGTTFNTITGYDGIGSITHIPSGTYRIEAAYRTEKDLIPQLHTSIANGVAVADSGSPILVMHLLLENPEE